MRRTGISIFLSDGLRLVAMACTLVAMAFYFYQLSMAEFP